MMYGVDNWWFMGMGLMLLFWIAVILLVIWGVRSLFPQETGTQHDHALEILRERYAAGKIDAEEYERTRATLEKTSVASSPHDKR